MPKLAKKARRRQVGILPSASNDMIIDGSEQLVTLNELVPMPGAPSGGESPQSFLVDKSLPQKLLSFILWLIYQQRVLSRVTTSAEACELGISFLKTL